MKKLMVITLAILFVEVSVVGQKIKIKGQVSKDIQSVTLKSFNGRLLEFEEVAKVVVNDGVYSIRTEVNRPNLYHLDFSGKKTVVLSITREKEIRVDLAGGEVNIKGSAESIALQNFEKENGALQAKHFAQLKKDADAAMASGDKEAMQKIQQRSAQAIQNFLPELRQWIIDKGVGPAGYLAIEYSDFNKELEFIESQLKEFEKEIPDSELTKALALRVYRSKVVSIGKVPPAIEANDREGEPFDLDQYKGKVLLVDFWAAWCRACRIENPQFVELYEKFNTQGFEVVSISQDKTKETWDKAIAKDGVGIWRHIWDKEQTITDLYGVGSLPQNVVLGRDGKIIAKNVNAEKLQELLEKAL